MWQLLKEDIRCVFERDPAARSLFDVLTVYSGVHALLFHRLNHWLWGHGLRWPARFLGYVSRWITGVEIHPGATIGRRFFVDHGTGVVIGETAEIGDDVTLYQGVTLGGRTLDAGKRHPTIGDGVIIGAGAKILGPFTVGEGSRIGSNAVVLEEVPPGATVVGVPGRVVRCRDANVRCLELVTAGSRAVEPSAPFPAYGVDADGLSADALEQSVERLQKELEALREEVRSLRDGSVPARTGSGQG